MWKETERKFIERRKMERGEEKDRQKERVRENE